MPHNPAPGFHRDRPGYTSTPGRGPVRARQAYPWQAIPGQRQRYTPAVRNALSMINLHDATRELPFSAALSSNGYIAVFFRERHAEDVISYYEFVEDMISLSSQNLSWLVEYTERPDSFSMDGVLRFKPSRRRCEILLDLCARAGVPYRALRLL